MTGPDPHAPDPSGWDAGGWDAGGDPAAEDGLLVKCADCWCVLTHENTSTWNVTRYCDHCLMVRLRNGERVTAMTPTPAEGEHLDEADVEPMFFYLCERCGGSGTVILTAWQPGTDCFRCGGTGVAEAFGRSVQRWQRWSATYQSNKEAEAKQSRRLR